MALSTVGLVAMGVTSASAAIAPSQDCTPAATGCILETFGSASATGPLELQQQEVINAPTSVTQGNVATLSIPGGSQTVPTTQSGVTVNYISGLTTIIPIPAGTSFASGTIVGGSYSGTSPTTTSGGVTTPGGPVSGPVTITYCTGSGTPGCDALANGDTIPGSSPAATWPAPTLTNYIEESTGTAKFAAGTTLTLPTWSFGVTATGTGSFQTSVAEFNTNANVVVFGSALNATVNAYPAAPVSGCLTTGGTCTTPPYEFQPITQTTINSPPAAPVLAPQTGNVSAGQCTTINVLTGSTDTGTGDSADPTSVVVTTAPTNGTATSNGDGTVTYCNTGGTAATDTFAVTANDTLASPPLTSAPVTETINISYNQCSAGTGNASGGSTGSLTPCSLHQEIVLPVTPGQIVLSQANGLPTDVLGASFCTGGTTPGITLNGDAQTACGRVDPVTVTNATGLDTGWTLTGQTTDFNDPADPALTCDTTATYSNHCIPGGNLSWLPDSAVSHTIVPGDTAQVTSGAAIAPFSAIAPVATADPILAPTPTQGNPVSEPTPNAGLQAAPQTMCSTASGQSGGTFTCGAGLSLQIPASVAMPAAGAYGPAYQASLTLTLS